MNSLIPKSEFEGMAWYFDQLAGCLAEIDSDVSWAYQSEDIDLSKKWIDNQVRQGLLRLGDSGVEKQCPCCPKDESWWPANTQFFFYHNKNKSLFKNCIACSAEVRRKPGAKIYNKPASY